MSAVPTEVSEQPLSFEEHKAQRQGKPVEKPVDAEPKGEVELTPEQKAEALEKERKTNDVKSYKARMKEAESRAAAAERERDELRAKVNPPAETGKPERAKFKDEEEYADALADWKIEQKEVKKAQEAKRKEWERHASETKAEFPDFDDVMAEGASMEVNGWVSKALVDSDMLPRLQYHLSANPEELEALNALKTRDGVIKAIGRLEDKLSAKKPLVDDAQLTKSPVKLVSAAPTPITPLKGNQTAAQASIQEGKFTGTAADYRAQRQAGLIK